MHQHYVISVVSRDRIGIVADVSGALAALGGDIADLRQSVLRDTFTDDGAAGVGCFDRSTVAAEVDIDFAVDKVEVRTVNTSGGTAPTGAR